jgi:tight adherence protein C
MTAMGVVWGVVLGLGIALLYAWAVSRKPRLADRIGPHVRSAESGAWSSQTATVTPFPTLERILAPVLREGVQLVERWGSPSAELEQRLARAGRSMSVEAFRADQVIWALGGLAGGVGLSVVLASSRGASPLVLLVLTAAAALAGAALRDVVLTRAVRRREARILAELPTVAELLALAVGAGEGALGALERVSRTTHGALADDLRQVLAAARTGTPLPAALRAMGTQSGVPALRRFTDGTATAIERGTPLAEVLRSQAQDVRADGRRALMEEGGKREIAMLVPVVFLILPVTVIFAVYPGLVAIRFDM